MPQLNLVPVSPSWSRMTQSSGVSGATSTECRTPFTVRSSAIAFLAHSRLHCHPSRTGGPSLRRPTKPWPNLAGELAGREFREQFAAGDQFIKPAALDDAPLAQNENRVR